MRRKHNQLTRDFELLAQWHSGDNEISDDVAHQALLRCEHWVKFALGVLNEPAAIEGTKE